MRLRLFITTLFVMCAFSSLLFATQPGNQRAATSEPASVNIANYLTQIHAIRLGASNALQQLGEGLKVAKQSNNRDLRNSILFENDAILSSAIEKLKNLIIPEKLKTYHEKIINAYLFQKLANQSFRNDSFDSASELYRQGTLSYLEALEELRKVYINLEAPSATIRNIEETISNERKKLEEANSPIK